MGSVNCQLLWKYAKEKSLNLKKIIMQIMCFNCAMAVGSNTVMSNVNN